MQREVAHFFEFLHPCFDGIDCKNTSYDFVTHHHKQDEQGKEEDYSDPSRCRVGNKEPGDPEYVVEDEFAKFQAKIPATR